ncbi:MAG: hypothetical protein V3V50_06575 [Gammaproteobacteria bacterium]
MLRRGLLWVCDPINKTSMRLSSLLLLLSAMLIFELSVVMAGSSINKVGADSASCSSKQRVIVLTGQKTPALIGLPIQRIALYRWTGEHLQPIVFQIDRRDEEDRYVFSSETITKTDTAQIVFDENDELVFLLRDTSLRMPSQSQSDSEGQLIEIIINDQQQVQHWVYVRLLKESGKSSLKHYINYNPETDSVSTNLYQLGFSRQTPFLVDVFRWWDETGQQWSPDLLDTMKIRHSGKLFGLLSFNRTHKDYSSELVAIKVGPVRVIRRTENRVRVFLGLKSPALTIDYVLSPDGFVMDTLVDIPFSMGLVFSQLETLTTVDWSSEQGLPAMLINNEQLPDNLQIDGTMSEKKAAFNKISATSFGIENSLGTMQVRLDIPEDFPIEAFLYLNDAVQEPDPPENIVGQFGNVGFKTTGWENIDTEVKHLLFTVCLY